MKIDSKITIHIDFLLNSKIVLNGVFLFLFSHIILILIYECYVLITYYVNCKFLFIDVVPFVPSVLGILSAIVLGLALGLVYKKKNSIYENHCILGMAVFLTAIAILLYFIFSDKIYFFKEEIRWGKDYMNLEAFVNTKKTDLLYFVLNIMCSLILTIEVFLMYIFFFLGYRKVGPKSVE